MTLMVSIPPDVEAKLRRRAAAEGRDASEYASQLLEQALRRSSLEEILAPLRQQFAASGVTDDALIEEITSARAAYRKQP